ncbi:hypothetical protein BDY24DRAFT_356684 [Mrakia frigida]|uniref:CorA family magnesium transporter n=1 Tax=Mrakia frigida TaxID=29902 RepID=UPI003FCBF9EB
MVPSSLLLPRSSILLFPHFLSLSKSTSSFPSSRRPPRPPPSCHRPFSTTSPFSFPNPLLPPISSSPASIRSKEVQQRRRKTDEPAPPYWPPKIAEARAEYESVIEKWAFPGTRKDANLELRCTIFDQKGEVSQRTYRKAHLCAENGLDPRDLRRVDSTTPNLVPTILVRKHTILATVLHIRCLVKADQVIIFDTVGTKDSKLQSGFIAHLTTNLRLRNSEVPYEFRALESVLVSVCGALEAEMTYTRKIVNDLLAELEDNITREKLRSLLHHSRRLTGFNNRATGVMECIEEVLENDEDMVAMYLADQRTRPLGTAQREEKDHGEIEILLESVQRQVEEIVNEVETTVTNVQSTQEIVELILDANRNKLLGLDLQVSIATLGVGSSALVAGLFGMNLQTHYESDPFAWYFISLFAISFAYLLTYLGFRRLRSVMKIGLGNSAKIAETEFRWLDRISGGSPVHSTSPHNGGSGALGGGGGGTGMLGLGGGGLGGNGKGGKGGGGRGAKGGKWKGVGM